MHSAIYIFRIPQSTSHLSISVNNILVTRQFLDSARSACVILVRADPDFGPQTEHKKHYRTLGRARNSRLNGACSPSFLAGRFARSAVGLHRDVVGAARSQPRKIGAGAVGASGLTYFDSNRLELKVEQALYRPIIG